MKENIKVAGKVIGYVYPILSDDPGEKDWGYWHNPSDNGGSGVGKKETAIEFLKQDHSEWLAQRKDDLKDALKDLQPFFNVPLSWVGRKT